MKVGDLIVDGDGRKGVVTAIIQSFTHSPCAGAGVGMAFFFAAAEEEIIYEEDVFVIGG